MKRTARALVKAGHRAEEVDVVERARLPRLDSREPDDQDENGQKDRQDEGADERMAGGRLHSGGLVAAGGGSAARAGEIGLDPGVRIAHQFRDCADFHLFVDEHRDAVADRIAAVEVVRHHEHGQAEALLQVADQLVEGRGADRVEPGGRLVEEDDARGRAPARGRARRACACRPRARTGYLAPASAGRPTMPILSAAISSHQRLRQVECAP